DDAVPPRQLNRAVPADLETICLKCLRKESGKRYQSAADLADDLRRWQAGEPIAARPASTVERAVKWARRRPTAASLLGAGALAALLLAVLSVVATWEWHVGAKALKGEREARREEGRQRMRRALAQVDTLLSANPRAVPAVLDQFREPPDEV